MNTSRDSFDDVYLKHFISVALGVIITYINGLFVFIIFRNPFFYTESKYILYISLIINDIVMLFTSVSLQENVNVVVCFLMLLLGTMTANNSPLYLAAMALERFIAICKPLHHPQLCTVKKTYACIGLIWLLNFMHTIADIVFAVLDQNFTYYSLLKHCHPSKIFGTTQHLIKSIVTQIFFFSSVLLTLVFTYFKVVQAAKAANVDHVLAKNAQNTILLHGVQFLLCIISFTSPFINYFILALPAKYQSNISYTTYILTNVLPVLLSPLIYGVRDQKLVKYVSMYLKCS